MGEPTNGTRPSAATRWQVTVESWPRRQGLMAIRHNQIRKVSPNLRKLGAIIKLALQSTVDTDQPKFDLLGVLLDNDYVG
jgi:hypothetical protein